MFYHCIIKKRLYTVFNYKICTCKLFKAYKLKNRIMKLNVLILGLCLTFKLISQNEVAETSMIRYPPVLPPSPEAASISKYADFPVSYFHGLPQIDLPFYEIRCGDLAVPVSISYHGGGITVNEYSGRVGLGWTLNAGGVISRSVNGVPDEALLGEYYGINDDLEDIHVLRGYHHLFDADKRSIEWNMNKLLEYDPSDMKHDRQQENLYRQIRLWYNFEGGFMDSAPDRYNFNFLGYSGTFMMEPDFPHKVILQTESPVEIITNNFPYYFILRDQKGFRYHFDVKEESYYPYTMCNPYFIGNMVDNPPIDSLKYVSSWYLSEIISPQKDTIRFQYSEMDEVKIFIGRSESHTLSYGTIAPNSAIRNENLSSDSIRYIPKRLDRIISRDAIVSFITGFAPRRDIKNDRTRLDAIEIKTPDGQSRGKYNFYYSYFTENKFNPDDPVNALKLDSIYELSYSGREYFPLYRFTYYGNGYRPRFSQDHWGYYNKGEEDASLVPPFAEKLWESAFGPGDRTPTSTGPLYASLTSISYPTGGKVTFDWEPNTYSYVKTQKIDTPDKTEEVEATEQLCGLQGKEKLTAEIRLTTPRTVKFMLKSYYQGLAEFMNREHWPDYYYNHTESAGENDFPVVRVYYRGEDGKRNELFASVFLDKVRVENGSESYDVYLPFAGQYRFILDNPRSTMNNVSGLGLLSLFTSPDYYGDGTRYGNLFIKYTTHKVYGNNPIAQGGGLRIKRIISHFQGDSVAKVYRYGDPDLSTGVLLEYPDYRSQKCLAYRWEYPNDIISLKIAHDVIYTMWSTGFYHTPVGSPQIEYRQVDELYGFHNPEGEAGAPQVQYYYSTAADDPLYNDMDETKYGQFQPPSGRIRTSMAHWRGNLKKKVYLTTNGGFQRIKRTEYKYRIDEDPFDHYFSGGLFVISEFSLTMRRVQMPGKSPELVKSDYGIAKYRLIPYNKKLIEEREVTEATRNPLDPVIRDTMEVITRYNYWPEGYENPLWATLPVSQERRDSQGKTDITYFTYQRHPSDHRFTDKIATRVRVQEGVVTEAERNVYNEDLQVIASYRAKIPQDGIGASSYPLGLSLDTPEALITWISEPEYTYTYDEYHNLKEIYYKDEILASFLWGYRGTHPIAEIKNKTAAEVEQALSRTGMNRTYFYSSTGDIKNDLDRLRAQLPGADMTTLSFHWLMGIASATDARGITAYYRYDDFGRLSEARDYNRYLMQKYDYHYQKRP